MSLTPHLLDFYCRNNLTNFNKRTFDLFMKKLSLWPFQICIWMLLVIATVHFPTGLLSPSSNKISTGWPISSKLSQSVLISPLAISHQALNVPSFATVWVRTAWLSVQFSIANIWKSIQCKVCILCFSKLILWLKSMMYTSQYTQGMHKEFLKLLQFGCNSSIKIVCFIFYVKLSK